MLVLTRKLGETVVIAGGIVVTILEVRSGQVKIGFDAPIEIRINRGEIQARIDREVAHGA